MLSRFAWIIYKKELRETLRDRKTLAIMVLLPLALYPVLLVGTAGVMAALEAEREARISLVALSGGASSRLTTLFSDPTLKIELTQVTGEPRAALDRGDLTAVIELPKGFDEATRRGERPQLRVLYDAAEEKSMQARDRIRDATDSFATVRVDVENIASGKRIGAFVLSQVLPFAVVFMVVLGAFYPAIDVTAGERERSTLETLLSAPVDRNAIVLGKFLAVATIALATGVLNLGSLATTFGYLMRLANDKVMVQIPWLSALATSLAIVPAACFFSALFLAVASLARSFKEAQNLLTPVYLVATLPAMVAALPGSKLTYGMAFAPGANLALLAKDLVQGKAALGPSLIALATTLIYASLLLGLAARLYASERVLFAESDRELGFGDRLKLMLGLSRSPDQVRDAPSGAEAMALLAINVVLLIFAAAPLQQRDMARGLLVSQWGFLLGSTVLFLRACNVSLSKALLFRLPPVRQLALGAVAGLAAGTVVHAVVFYLLSHLPGLEHAGDELQKALFPSNQPRNLPVELFVFAVTPAICEELLFRGALLSGLRRTLPKGTAIALQAILFGLFHLSPFRLLPTTLLGLALGHLAVQSRSILPGILFHACNNAFAILVLRYGLSERLRPDAALGLSLAVLALPILAVSLLLARAPSVKM